MIYVAMIRLFVFAVVAMERVLQNHDGSPSRRPAKEREADMVVCKNRHSWYFIAPLISFRFYPKTLLHPPSTIAIINIMYTRRTWWQPTLLIKDSIHIDTYCNKSL